MAMPANSAAAEYFLPATRRGIAAQAAPALGILNGSGSLSPRCSSRCSTGR